MHRFADQKLKYKGSISQWNKNAHRNAINCEVLTGTVRNKRILIPRIHLTYFGTILLFNLQRTQSPIIPALAMTISLKDKHLKKLENFLNRPDLYIGNCVSQ